MDDLDLKYRRFWVKICGGPAKGGNPCIYFNKDFPYDLFNKWVWYFEYRAALFKVLHPKHSIHYQTGSYTVVPTKDIEIKSLRNQITSKKAAITKEQNKLKINEDYFAIELKKQNKMFIETDPDYILAIEQMKNFKQKISLKIFELNNIQEQYNQLLKT